jgi:hypothetical protein
LTNPSLILFQIVVDVVTVAAEIEATEVAAGVIEVAAGVIEAAVEVTEVATVEIVGVLETAANVPGPGNDVAIAAPNRRMAKAAKILATIRAPDAVNLHCTGTCRHQALSISPRCSTKPCKRPVKFQPTLLPTLHR